jgi:predicted membrane-bound spermidine synthase
VLALNVTLLLLLPIGALLFVAVWRRSSRLGEPTPWIYYLFFFSGFPALIYQIVWERALFALYGVNVESVTVVVTGFLLGLGLGSLAGGYLSRIPGAPLLALFGAAELSTAAYGLFSLRLFHQVGHYTAGISLFGTTAISFALLLIPTMLMGSTLPMLVAYSVRRSRSVGGSLGLLYFVNTLGSATACFLAAAVAMAMLGQSGSVAAGAAINATVGIGALAVYYLHRAEPVRPWGADSFDPVDAAHDQSAAMLSLPVAAIFVGLSGFIALAYEILWYRLFSFSSGSDARVFAYLLGAYLAGIALGGLVAHDLTNRATSVRSKRQYLRLIAWFVVFANLAGFVAAPAMGLAAQHLSVSFVMLIIAVGAAFLAATFPLISHIAIANDTGAGYGISLLYFSNIVGSALGSFVVGFVLMNFWGARDISVFLVLAGVALGISLLAAGGPSRGEMCSALAAAAAVCVAIPLLANPLFNDLYEKLLFKTKYHPHQSFGHLVENRSGVIAVTQQGEVFGGGVYDGFYNVDPMHDVNGLFRIYALSSFHPLPRKVLMIGLSSGSWAQIVANDPEVQSEEIVEINPGYLPLIPQYPPVRSLLHNPKVHIIVDDGRRWLLANPDASYDAIVMNTTFNWREHATNLLSVEFLKMVRQHLLPGGVLFYNTTHSREVLLTGVTVFPYGLRVGNFLALSDRPIVVNSDRLEKILRDYRIDGKLVFDLQNPVGSARFHEMIAMTHRFNTDESLDRPSMEYADSIRSRCRGSRIITDDNMGTEWAR